MAIYVILHGATTGGWYMRTLAKCLQIKGNEVLTPTLTGFGERSHLLNPEVGLNTHIQDVVNVLYYEDLNDVILVGKSYSGTVITGVAEQVPERLSHLVYVDTVVPEDGQCLADVYGPEIMAWFRQRAQVQGEGWRIPANRSKEPRFADGSLKSYLEPVKLENPAAAALPRTYIHCVGKPPDSPFTRLVARSADKARAKGWSYHELPCGHEPERDMPQELADLLLELA